MSDEKIEVEANVNVELTRRDTLWLITGISLIDEVPLPTPSPPKPEPGPEVKVVIRNYGDVPGNAPFSYLDEGGSTCYDYHGTVRTTHLKNGVWQGTRSLYMIDGGKNADGSPKQENPNHRGARITGGAWICPEMDENPDWEKRYQSKNVTTGTAHFRECSLHDIRIDNLRVHGGFDGIQNGSGTRGRCSDLTIDHVALTMMRDDGLLENDNWWDDVLVEDSLLDGFVFFSCRNTGYDGSKENNYFRRNVVRLRPMMFEQAMTTGTVFKLNKNSVRLHLYDSVIAAEGPPHRTIGGAFGDALKHNKIGDCAGNRFCWLGSGRNPHAMPSKGVEVLEGDEAQQCLAKATADFWQAYQGHRFAFDPPAAAAA